MIKSLAAAAILALGMSGAVFDGAVAKTAQGKAAHSKSMQAKSNGHMCYHTVKGKKMWHNSAKACSGGKMAMKKM
jgi:hypothetical protein